MKNEPTYTGTKIGPILSAQGRKAKWLAAQAGISESYLSMIISGKRTIARPLAERLAQVLQVPFFVAFDVPEGVEKALAGTEAAA